MLVGRTAHLQTILNWLIPQPLFSNVKNRFLTHILAQIIVECLSRKKPLLMRNEVFREKIVFFIILTRMVS